MADLRLKTDAFDFLELPLTIHSGTVARFKLEIPWASLGRSPVKVIIEDVLILVGPKEFSSEIDSCEVLERAHVRKLRLLASAEKSMLSMQNSQENQQAGSFVERFTTRVLDNLQITVKNFHIRYEDYLSSPGRPFALGITLDQFSMFTCDDEGTSTFLDRASAESKLLPVQKFASAELLVCYCDTVEKESKPMAEWSTAEINSKLLATISTKSSMDGETDDGGFHQYILHPCSVQLRLKLNQDDSKVKLPRYFVTAETKEVNTPSVVVYFCSVST
jgi:vacuolar protein sorting-associated protein 13A/C